MELEDVLSMIEPARALRELLEQHAALRAIMDECEDQADKLDAGRGDVAALAREIVKLREAFEAHNRVEEQILPVILRCRDTVDDRRIDHLVSDHIHEHRALQHCLDGATTEVRATLYELRAHLATEERSLLSA